MIYYISPSGSDSNTGSQTSPWKSLYKAASSTIFGDTIHVLPGTYTETQQSNLKAGVSIEGEGKGISIIKSSLSGDWSTLIEMYSPDNTNANQSISNITLDGQYVSSSSVKTWVAFWITGRSNVSIHDCELKNFKQSSTIFNGNGTTTNPGTDVGQNFAKNNKFYNNTVNNCSAMYNGTGQGALMLGFQEGMEIYGNVIIQNQRPNFQNGWPIKYWNQGWLRGTKIYDNTLTKIPYSGSYSGENGNWDFCIEFFNASGTEIYGNKIQGAIDLAYNYKGNYSYSVFIHNNILSHDVQGTKVEGAIILEYRTEAAIIKDNKINNKTYGVSFNTRGYNENGDDRYYINPTPVGGYSYIVDCVIDNNLFTGMYAGTGQGNRFGIGVISDGPEDSQIKNLVITNNTIIAKSGDASHMGIDLGSMPNGKGLDIVLENNIVQGFQWTWIQGSNGKTAITGMIVRNNDAYQNGNNNIPLWPAGNPINYTYTGNQAVNPQFDSNYVSALGIGYKPAGTPPPSQCTYTYSAWGACVNGTQTRTVISALPQGCTGTPILTQLCSSPVNTPPVVNAGADDTIVLKYTLTGSATDNDSVVSYKWTKQSGPTGLVFETSTAPVTNITGIKKGTYVFKLTATDNQGLTGSDTKTLIVQ